MPVAVTAMRLNPMRSPKRLNLYLARAWICSLSGSVATHGVKLKAVTERERDVRQRANHLGRRKATVSSHLSPHVALAPGMNVALVP